MERYTIKQNETLKSSSVNFDLPIGEDYALNLRQAELFNSSYLEKVKKENINPIIDYEKQMFYPVYTSLRDKYRVNTYDVTQIRFNLYMRKRDKDDNGDYGDWDAEEGGYWNLGIPSLPSDGTSINPIYGYGDLLGDLGFTDDDVKYQKNVLKKSFIRISIYDTPYRQTQKLLYYSTLFFDSNVIYKKYTNLCAKDKNFDDKVYLEPNNNITPDECLTATFTCAPKHDDTASSDGFYLYLFDSVVQKTNTVVYLKVEFNHAKYGKTIPLIWPHFHEKIVNDNKVIHKLHEEISFYGETRTVNGSSVETNYFPTDYETENINGNSYVDMSKLYGDLYIPIEVSYNAGRNRYEWEILSIPNKHMSGPNWATEDIININLFEPRINRLKQTPNGKNT